MTGLTPEKCLEHLSYAGGTCPDCGDPIDAYGNTENQFDYCSFPDCGCDGARLCDAQSGPSAHAASGNVEGMWSGKSKEQKRAVLDLVGFAGKRAKKND